MNIEMTVISKIPDFLSTKDYEKRQNKSGEGGEVLTQWTKSTKMHCMPSV